MNSGLPSSGPLSVTDLQKELTDQGANPWSGWEPRVTFKPKLIETNQTTSSISQISPVPPHTTSIVDAPMSPMGDPMFLGDVAPSGMMYYYGKVTSDIAIVQAETSGNEAWSKSFANETVTTVKSAPGNKVIVVSTTSIYCLNADTGAQIWTAKHGWTLAYLIYGDIEIAADINAVIIINGLGYSKSGDIPEDDYDVAAFSLVDGSRVADNLSYRRVNTSSRHWSKTTMRLPVAVNYSPGWSNPNNVMLRDGNAASIFVANGDTKQLTAVFFGFNFQETTGGAVGVIRIRYGYKLISNGAKSTVRSSSHKASGEMITNIIEESYLHGASVNRPHVLNDNSSQNTITLQELDQEGIQVTIEVTAFDGGVSGAGVTVELDYVEVSITNYTKTPTLEYVSLSSTYGQFDGQNRLYVGSYGHGYEPAAQVGRIEERNPQTLDEIRVLNIPETVIPFKMEAGGNNQLVIVGIDQSVDPVALKIYIYNVQSNVIERTLVPDTGTDDIIYGWLACDGESILYQTTTRAWLYNLVTGNLVWSKTVTDPNTESYGFCLSTGGLGLLSFSTINQYQGNLSTDYSYVGFIDENYLGDTGVLADTEITQPGNLLHVSRGFTKAIEEIAKYDGWATGPLWSTQGNRFSWVVSKENATGKLGLFSSFIKNVMVGPTIPNVPNNVADLEYSWKYSVVFPNAPDSVKVGRLIPPNTLPLGLSSRDCFDRNNGFYGYMDGSDINSPGWTFEIYYNGVRRIGNAQDFSFDYGISDDNGIFLLGHEIPDGNGGTYFSVRYVNHSHWKTNSAIEPALLGSRISVLPTDSVYGNARELISIGDIALNHYDFLAYCARNNATVTIELTKKPPATSQPAMSLDLYRDWLDKTVNEDMALSEFYGKSGRLSYEFTLTQGEYNALNTTLGSSVDVSDWMGTKLGLSYPDKLPEADYTLINTATIVGGYGSLWLNSRQVLAVSDRFTNGSTLRIINDGTLRPLGGGGSGSSLAGGAGGDGIYVHAGVSNQLTSISIKTGIIILAGGGGVSDTVQHSRTVTHSKGALSSTTTYSSFARGGAGGGSGSGVRIASGTGSTASDQTITGSAGTQSTDGTATAGGSGGTASSNKGSLAGSNGGAQGAPGQSGRYRTYTQAGTLEYTTYPAGGAGGVAVRNNSSITITYL